LRAPRVHEIFGIDNAQGLSTYLQGGDDPNYFLSATEVAQLVVLSSGPVEGLPAEAMESPRMGDLVKALREKYDVVLFDAPPLQGVGAALTLARLVDTNVWVIRSGESDRRAVGWAKHLLKNVRADVAGVVLNRAPSREGQRFYLYPAMTK
jgi:capsular exopolysaccharide synthesis family protein